MPPMASRINSSKGRPRPASPLIAVSAIPICANAPISAEAFAARCRGAARRSSTAKLRSTLASAVSITTNCSTDGSDDVGDAQDEDRLAQMNRVAGCNRALDNGQPVDECGRERVQPSASTLRLNQQ